MKRVIAIMLAFIVAFGCANAVAADADIKSVQGSTATLTLHISTSGVATCQLTCKGKAGVTSINGLMTLYRENDSGTLTKIDQWSASSETILLTMTESANVDPSASYKLVGTAVFFSPSGNERIDKTAY